MSPGGQSQDQISVMLQWMLVSEYTRRYQQIVMSLPGSVLFPDPENENESLRQAVPDTQDRERTEAAIRAYIDLCAEQLFLNSQGVVPQNVWLNWKEGISCAFALPAVREIWEKAREQLGYDDLAAFVKPLL